MSTDLRIQNWIRDNGVASIIDSKTGTVTLDNTNTFVEANGTFTITLPAIADVTKGKMYYIKNIGTGSIMVDGNGSETIDDATTQVINFQHDCMVIINTGTEWRII